MNSRAEIAVYLEITVFKLDFVVCQLQQFPN